MLYDVFVDIRKVLPLIQKGLKKLGKLDEFIEDNERCAMMADGNWEESIHLCCKLQYEKYPWMGYICIGALSSFFY